MYKASFTDSNTVTSTTTPTLTAIKQASTTNSHSYWHPH